jgi:hypothetical protein
MVVQAEAKWSTQVDNKQVWDTIIKMQPGGNGHQGKGHMQPMEIAVKWETWKSLLDNLYLEGATHNLKGEDEAYKHASHNALGGILMFTTFSIQRQNPSLRTHVSW